MSACRHAKAGGGVATALAGTQTFSAQRVPVLPFPRIFENSQKNLRRARIKKKIRKWKALPKKIRDFFAILQ